MILDTLPLPPGLVWTDEHTSASVAQTMRRALDGSLVVYYAGLVAGRPITLESTETAGWITRAQADALAALAASPGAVYTLTLRGQAYQVMFRHHEPPAFSASGLWPYANPQAGDYYRAVIKLMTV